MIPLALALALSASGLSAADEFRFCVWLQTDDDVDIARAVEICDRQVVGTGEAGAASEPNDRLRVPVRDDRDRLIVD